MKIYVDRPNAKIITTCFFMKYSISICLCAYTYFIGHIDVWTMFCMHNLGPITQNTLNNNIGRACWILHTWVLMVPSLMYRLTLNATFILLPVQRRVNKISTNMISWRNLPNLVLSTFDGVTIRHALQCKDANIGWPCHVLSIFL